MFYSGQTINFARWSNDFNNTFPLPPKDFTPPPGLQMYTLSFWKDNIDGRNLLIMGAIHGYSMYARMVPAGHCVLMVSVSCLGSYVSTRDVVFFSRGFLLKQPSPKFRVIFHVPGIALSNTLVQVISFSPGMAA